MTGRVFYPSEKQAQYQAKNKENTLRTEPSTDFASISSLKSLNFEFNHHWIIEGRLTWLATKSRAMAFCLLEKTDLLPPDIDDIIFMERALKANRTKWRRLQTEQQIANKSLIQNAKATE